MTEKKFFKRLFFILILISIFLTSFSFKCHAYTFYSSEAEKIFDEIMQLKAKIGLYDQNCTGFNSMKVKINLRMEINFDYIISNFYLFKLNKCLRKDIFNLENSLEEEVIWHLPSSQAACNQTSSEDLLTSQEALDQVNSLRDKIDELRSNGNKYIEKKILAEKGYLNASEEFKKKYIKQYTDKNCKDKKSFRIFKALKNFGKDLKNSLDSIEKSIALIKEKGIINKSQKEQNLMQERIKKNADKYFKKNFGIGGSNKNKIFWFKRSTKNQEGMLDLFLNELEKGKVFFNSIDQEDIKNTKKVSKEVFTKTGTSIYSGAKNIGTSIYSTSKDTLSYLFSLIDYSEIPIKSSDIFAKGQAIKENYNFNQSLGKNEFSIEINNQLYNEIVTTALMQSKSIEKELESLSQDIDITIEHQNKDDLKKRTKALEKLMKKQCVLKAM